VWSFENLVLALAVYNRLSIYIGFNGMTRMRMIGIFGMSSVVVGFVLVVWKVANRRDFVWLIQRQLWTLAVAAYLFALTPVDAIAHAYNTRCILAGDPAPSVQISVHPIDAEGILALHPLSRCDNKIIREGVQSLLADRALAAESAVQQRREQGWTTFQLSERMMLRKLEAIRGDWQDFLDPERRVAALARFRKYAYQWY
jgi:hypothetical protein